MCGDRAPHRACLCAILSAEAAHSSAVTLFFIALQDKLETDVFARVCCSDGLSFQYCKAGQICEERSKNVKGFLKYLILFLKWLESKFFVVLLSTP